MKYIIIVGLECEIYSSIFKCERTGQNLIFSNAEDAEKKANEVRRAGGTKVKVVAI